MFLSLVLLFAVIQTKTWIFTNFANNKLLISFVEFITRHKTEGYINPGTQQFLKGHLSNIAFFIVAFIVYGIIGLIFQPQSKPSDRKKEAAALMYVMLIIMMIAPLSGSLTFYFDYYRVPVFLLFVVIVALMYALFKVDHFFELNLNEAKKYDAEDFKKAIEKRLEYQGEEKEKTLVVVCASGGGIQAAGWTVQVLTGLQDMLGNSFTKSIGFISSVSGGSVGTMYYLDRFADKGYPESKEFENIFKSATEDSLDAVGWGLAYPDLWRIIGLPFLAPKMCDRAAAMVTDWQGELKNPNSKQFLSTWGEQILNGKIPIPIFNATLVEDGRRFLISPMTFDKHSINKSVDFNTLYAGYDIDVVTAARLSATFSYVSPISRYVSENENPERNYHIADGGYFDNSGMVTMVEWLNEWLDPQKGLNIKRVLLLQINAFPESTSSKSTIEGGWFQAIIGPLLTLFSVRDTTQLSRVSTEVKLLKQRWENQVKIAYCPIFFPKNGKNGEYKPPLSWTLTEKQKQNIKNGWCGIKEEIGKQIGEQIGEEWKKWGFEDPSQKSTNEK